MKAKKSFGQHFLISEEIALRIVESLTTLERDNNILEVGPGKGVLTKYLLEKTKFLKVVEADRDMVEYLVRNYPDLENDIIRDDFLKVSLNGIFKSSFSVIGNFPYNISSQILFKVLDYKDQVEEVVGMFQKEVAMRIASGPGNKIYGRISVFIQAWYDIEYLFGVGPENFDPPPKVQSAVIRLKRNSRSVLECDQSLFQRIVKNSFGQRRKMLRNTVKTMNVKKSLLQLEIMQKRPEQLSVEEFIDLTNLVSQSINSGNEP